jgi:hypothetical protein
VYILLGAVEIRFAEQQLRGYAQSLSQPLVDAAAVLDHRESSDEEIAEARHSVDDVFGSHGGRTLLKIGGAVLFAVVWFILMVLLFILEAAMLLWLTLEPDVVSDELDAGVAGESWVLLVFATAWVCIVPAVRLLAAPYTSLAQFWHVRRQVWALRRRRDRRTVLIRRT